MIFELFIQIFSRSLFSRKSLRVLCLPVPHVSTHFPQTSSALPSEHGLCHLTAGIQAVDISFSPWCDYVRNLLPASLRKSCDHLKDCCACASSQVEDVDSLLSITQDVVNCLNMPLSKIHNMNIIAIPRTIPGRVVVPVNRDLFSAANSHLGNVWHEVVWYSKWVLSYVTRLVGSSGVEIPPPRTIPGLVV